VPQNSKYIAKTQEAGIYYPGRLKDKTKIDARQLGFD